MKRRIFAVLLMVTIFINGLASPSYGNVQIQVEDVRVNDVFYVGGESPITGEPMIRPTMEIGWQDPDHWAEGTNPPTDTHNPSYYEVLVKNITRNISNTIRVNDPSADTLEIHERMNLDTGSLYQIEVRPFHTHTDEEGNVTMAPSTGTVPHAYAITDLNTSFISSDSSIQVIWDDLGQADFAYRIAYALGDYTNRSSTELISNATGVINGLTQSSDRIERFYDPVQRRNKLAYTITEGIIPGQVYSIMVEPRVESYNGDPVMRNRNYPIIRSTSTNILLNLYEEGEEVRLEWDVPDTFKVGAAQAQYELVEATIVRYRDGQANSVVIFDNKAAVIGYYKLPRPSVETDYQIKFVYRAVSDQSLPPIEPVSNIVTYLPSELMVTPTKPEIPLLFSDQVIRQLRGEGKSDVEIREILKNNYYVPNYSYNGNLDTLIEQNNTYHLIKDRNQINFIWSAFQRKDVDTDSPTYNQYIYDSNVYYDIWVTDSMEAMVYADRVVEEKRYGSSTPSNNINFGGEAVGYSEALSTYYKDATGDLTPITPNKLYYIKIVAKKRTSNGFLVSQPSFSTFYFNYEGDAYSPPSLSKPPLEIKEDETTTTSLTLTWGETWWEIIDLNAGPNDVLAQWQRELWVDEAGEIHDSKVANAEHFEIYKGTTEIDRFKAYVLSRKGQPFVDGLANREVDLGRDAFNNSDVEYRFLRIPYASALAEIENQKRTDPDYTFKDYYEALLKEDEDGTRPLIWTNITPSKDNITGKLSFTEIGLLPNTSYVFMVYPYRVLEDGTVLNAHYPSYIIGSTNPEEVVVNPDPTVPNLYISSYNQTSLGLTWKYNQDFTYELVYSIFEDVNKAQPVEWVLPEDETDPKYPVDGAYYELTVEDLFPNTEYYFWIRAKQSENNKTSNWSNAVLGRTKDVANPNPPKGFGIASIESMKKYDYDAAVTKDYLAVEWDLDLLDIAEPTEKKVKTNYVYIIEVSNNPSFIDPIYIESSGGVADKIPTNIELLQKNLVKINGLIANRSYYVRVKTRVIVTGPEAGQRIEKDSLKYTNVIKIMTATTSGEYDGNIDPDLEILPGEDFELIYDKDEEELIFRFRDNEIDEDGNRDNRVSQRLISKLIAQNIYVYEVDVEEYKNKTISKRTVKIPYSVVEAFYTHKVDLRIKAGDINVRLPYNAFMSQVTEQRKQFGVAPMIVIQIEELGNTYLKKNWQSSGIKQISEAQKLSIGVNSVRKEQSLSYTDQPMEIELMTSNKYEQFRVERLAAILDKQNNWHTLSSTFDGDTGYMILSTARIGAVSGYMPEDVNAALTGDQGHWSQNARKIVGSEYAIQGLTNYKPNKKVSETELVNVINAIIRGNKTVDLQAYISKDDKNALKRANIKTNDSWTNPQVSREEAIHMFVRAYELLQDEVIEPEAAKVELAKKNKDISIVYQISMAKAGSIYMVSDLNQARPKESISYGELFALWEKLINN